MKTSAIRRLFLLVATIILVSTCAQARPWYYPERISPSTVNPYLTPARIFDKCPASWHNQLVLWEGRVEQQGAGQQFPTLLLNCSGKNIPIKFVRKVRNLSVDRCGYHVAIKGRIQLHQGAFHHIDGLSVILISPPPQQSFAKWAATEPHSLASYTSWRIAMHQPSMPRAQAINIGKTLVETARTNGIDPLLFASLIQIESAYDPKAVSPSGAMGLGQLMPFTAQGLQVSDPFDPIQNLKGSGRMVGALVREWKAYPNPNALVLASYNAGPNKVRELKGKVPPYAETINYVYFIGLLRNILHSQTQTLEVF